MSFLLSCGSKPNLHSPIIELAFPENEYEIYSPKIKYQVGYLGNEKGYYGFAIDGNQLYIASISLRNGQVSKYNIAVSSCDELPELIEALSKSLVRSSKIALGHLPKVDSQLVMLDGLHYNIQYRGKLGTLSLSGFGIYELEMPWVQYAERINTAALICVGLTA